MNEYCVPSEPLAEFYWEEYLLVKWKDALAARLYVTISNGGFINVPRNMTNRFKTLSCYQLLRPYIVADFHPDAEYEIALALHLLTGDVDE